MSFLVGDNKILIIASHSMNTIRFLLNILLVMGIISFNNLAVKLVDKFN